MSKIDKIIQILDKGDGEILGLSESGVMYLWDGNWEHYTESPVVDNSAVENPVRYGLDDVTFERCEVNNDAGLSKDELIDKYAGTMEGG